MSYKDLEEARVKHAIKDAAKAKGKGKRGRKAKSAVPETEEFIAGKENLGRKRKNPESETKLFQCIWF